MNQPDQENFQTSPDLTGTNLEAQERQHETNKPLRTEWFPEDDDEWYEPDYCRNEGRRMS